MRVIGIDPGPTDSAFVEWDGKRILRFGNRDNHVLLDMLITMRSKPQELDLHVVVEQIRGFGVMASDALFDTCCWSGRFLQAFGEDRTHWVPRKEAAKHICGVGGISKDSFVREAIIARFGGPAAIGKKASPGLLYGISGHLWPALAVSLTWHDLNCKETF